MGLFSKSTSTSTTNVTEETTTTTVPQEIDGEENVTLAGIEGAVSIVEPGSTQASLELAQKSLESVDRTAGAVLSKFGDIVEKALDFASAETRAGQQAALKTQEQIASATRQESTKTLEKLVTTIAIAAAVVLVAFFWRR